MCLIIKTGTTHNAYSVIAQCSEICNYMMRNRTFIHNYGFGAGVGGLEWVFKQSVYHIAYMSASSVSFCDPEWVVCLSVCVCVLQWLTAICPSLPE